jgi:non-heme chloroperoxidase
MGQAIEKKTVVVGDGVRLNVLEAGRGAKTLVLVPGWSQTAEQFRFQQEGLAERYRVIAIDMRGHGDSDKPAHGLRIQRLAADLEEALAKLGLQGVTILGHSMGCSVLWCHFDLYGSARIAKYVFCDQMPFITTDPAWSEQERADYGSILPPEAVSATCNALIGADATATTEAFLRTMVTPAMPADQFRWVFDLNLKMPRVAAARLLYNHCHQDWRDVLPRIDKPCLFIGGKVSNVPHSSMTWNASQVKGAQLEIFEEAEKGSHFMFIENPGKFNRLLAGFVG